MGALSACGDCPEKRVSPRYADGAWPGVGLRGSNINTKTTSSEVCKGKVQREGSGDKVPSNEEQEVLGPDTRELVSESSLPWGLRLKAFYEWHYSQSGMFVQCVYSIPTISSWNYQVGRSSTSISQTRSLRLVTWLCLSWRVLESRGCACLHRSSSFPTAAPNEGSPARVLDTPSCLLILS